jgi:hypothetical protein
MFTSWRQYLQLLTVCLVFWVVAWVIWPEATLWMIAIAAGVMTSLFIGVAIGERIEAKRAFFKELEEERRASIEDKIESLILKNDDAANIGDAAGHEEPRRPT